MLAGCKYSESHINSSYLKSERDPSCARIKYNNVIFHISSALPEVMITPNAATDNEYVKILCGIIGPSVNEFQSSWIISLKVANCIVLTKQYLKRLTEPSGPC